MEKFKLHLELLDRKFEDSLELLLELIKINQINIFDIPVAEVTRQYIRYVEHYHKIDPEYASEFLVMAATLMYIKSKMLLPVDTEGLEDEDDDPREEIVHQLLEYQKYKQAAEKLEDLEETFTLQRDTSEFLNEIKSEEKWREATFNDLLKAFKKLMSQPKPDFFLKRPRVKFTVEDIMEKINNALNNSGDIKFLEFFKDFYWIELIVAFIAILELVRLQNITLKQDTVFDEIYIIKKQNLETKNGENYAGEEEKETP